MSLDHEKTGSEYSVKNIAVQASNILFQDCRDWCFTAANETYNDCLYPEITTGSPLPTALPEPETFAAKYESFDLLPEDFELCKKVAKEWSLECQMGCPCNPNCPTCSEMENTCNAEFCPVSAEFKPDATQKCPSL